MNKQRRASLKTALTMLESAAEIIRTCSEEESDSLSNMPESLQESDAGCEMSDNIESMDEAADEIDSAIDTIENLL